jgi:photosystem II stability/assembly factor-like uncharacterized protein
VHSRYRLLVVAVIAIATLIFLSPLFTASSAAAGSPSLMINPTSGPVGTTVTASGSGFSPGETVNIDWNAVGYDTVASTTADGSGAFSNVTFSVPAYAASGQNYVWAIGQTSGNSAYQFFTVTNASPTPTPTPTGTPGQSSSPTATPTPGGSPTAIATPTPTPSPGVTWTSLNACFPISVSLYGVGFNGKGTVVAVGQGGEIVKSTNDGSSWQTIKASQAGSLDLWSVAFADANTVWAGGQSGTLDVSGDGGTTWTPWRVTDSSGKAYYPNIHQIAFTSPSVGYLAGGEFSSVGGSTYEIGEVFRTTNGGSTWNLLSNVPAEEQWNSITFNGAGVGLAVATNGDIARTTDGVNWTKVNYTINRTLTKLNDVAFTADGTTAVAVGDNAVLLQSTDAGLSWQQVAAPADLPDPGLDNFEGIAFSSSTQGSAVGGVYCTGCHGQTAVSTGDAGVDWSTTYQNANLSYLWRIGCDSAVCIAVGDGGTLLASRVNAPAPSPPPGLQFHVFLPVVLRC